MSPRKRRIFFVVMVAIPILLIGGLEGALRLFHYGQDLSLFTTREVNGKTYYLLNHKVKARYFSDLTFAPTTSLDCFTIPKPSNTFRIFVLGGSTAVGYPYGPNASFTSFLRQRLKAVLPDHPVEVINLGMTATNSFTVLDLARELPAYEPDLLIVYDGHNEFYGGLGVNSRGLWGGSRFMSLLYLKLIHSRAFLLARDGYNALRSLFSKESGRPAHDVTMELLGQGKLIPLGSPVYLEGKRTFGANLQDLGSIVREYHIPLVLSTQVSNVRGQIPFASGDTAELSADARRAFAEHRVRGKSAWDQHLWGDALSEYRAAETIDSTRADIHFAIGRCLDIMGDKAEARREYIEARDDDQLRFRTSSEFNQVILSMRDSHSIGVVDMEGLFMSVSPDSLIGNELILEHLHPNAAGYFLMAKGYAEEMRRLGLLASPEEWAHRDTIDDRRLWNARTVTELDDRIAIERTARLTSGWPFAERALSVPATLPKDMLQQIAKKVIDAELGAGNAHQECAAYYEAQGDSRDAEREFRTVIALDPLQIESYWNLAQFYHRLSRADDEVTVLQSSIAIQPTAHAYAGIGELALRMGNLTVAEGQYGKALALSTGTDDEIANGYQLATIYMRQNRIDRAEAQIRKVLALSPQHQPALALLQAIQTIRGTK